MTDRLGNKISAIELRYDISEIVRDDLGLTGSVAEEVTTKITYGIQRRLGGRERYIPSEDKSDRDARIRQDFNGRNSHEVMKRYDISKASFYRIIGAK